MASVKLDKYNQDTDRQLSQHRVKYGRTETAK